MRKPVVVLTLASLLLAACEPVYWVDRKQLLDAQAGSPRVAPPVRVPAPNRRRRAGAEILGLGLGLGTLGLVFGIVATARTDCREEECSERNAELR